MSLTAITRFTQSGSSCKLQWHYQEFLWFWCKGRNFLHRKCFWFWEFYLSLTMLSLLIQKSNPSSHKDTPYNHKLSIFSISSSFLQWKNDCFSWKHLSIDPVYAWQSIIQISRLSFLIISSSLLLFHHQIWSLLNIRVVKTSHLIKLL